jgi:hypothetical protein
MKSLHLTRRNAKREKILTNSIVTYLNLRGHKAMRINSGAVLAKGKNGKPYLFRGAKAGTADVICCRRDGLFVAIEVKDGNNKVTALQNKFLSDIKKCGGQAIVAWSLDDVTRAGL